MKKPSFIHQITALILAPLLLFSLSPPLLGAVTGRSADSSLAGTEKLLSDSSGTDTYILVSTILAAQALTGGLTASGSSAWDFSGSTGAFKTSSGVNTFKGSAHNFDAVIQPTNNDGAALGATGYAWSDLYLASGATINFNSADWLATHSAGVLTIGTGELRITTPGTNAASVLTQASTNEVSNKTMVAQVVKTGLTASGSASNDFSASTGTFKTSTGVNTFGGSTHTFAGDAKPAVDGTGNLGTAALSWDNLYLNTAAVINFENGDAVITHSTGILTVSTGDLRVTTAGTNSASVVTVGGTQTLAAKTLTTPVLGVATATSINKVAITAPATSATLTVADGKTLTASNTLTLAGTDSTTFTFPPTTATVMTTSLSTNDIDAANAITGASNALVFEGATADAYEASLAPVDPTADQTVSIPNFAANYALMGSTLTTNTISAANSIWGASNALVFEGSSADASEISITPANATADVVYLLPDAAAASYAIMSSTLATNAPDIANSVYGVSAGLTFEGATANTSETNITATDPTGDRTVTLADASGTVVLSSLATNAPDAANSVTGASNAWVFEGATADAHEISLTPADATADVVYLLPDAAAASYSIMSSTLATNAPNIANSVTGASNALVFEGTADTSETTISATDPTADTTLTFPAKTASGTVEILSVEAEAATDTITAGQLYGSVITNTGASGAAVYTLPAPAVGMHFRVYLTVAQDVDINPADGTQILALTNAAGDAISSASTIGNCIELIALSTTTWAAFAVSGTWTDAN